MPYFEAGRAPVNKLDRPLSLNACNGSLYVLGDNITTVQQTTGHCDDLSVICCQETYDNSLYLPSLGSHFTIWLPFSKQENVISATEFCSWPALSAERRGA